MQKIPHVAIGSITKQTWMVYFLIIFDHLYIHFNILKRDKKGIWISTEIYMDRLLPTADYIAAVFLYKEMLGL
jgi:hypothetical protein